MQMNKLFTETGFKWLWLTVLFLIIDQVTKHLVVNAFDLGESMNILPFFDLRYVQNPGAAFSFLADQDGWQRWFFTIIAAVASVVFLVWLAKTPKSNPLLSIALAFMLSGAVGNLIDRVLFGYVIDMLDFHIAGNHWPVFNIADSAIFIGAAVMIFDSFKNGEPAKKSETK
ncbi:MAG: signal peptidase II [Colwellia sp.]|jgi:signal peptidase II